MLRERRADVVAILALVALTLIVFSPALLGGVYEHRDFPRWTWPSRELLHQAIVAGRLPQWNPTIALGVPTLAIPVHGTFYPPNLLLLIAPLGALFALHAAWAGIGGYLLARFLGCRPSAAWITGAVFAIGGYAVSMWGNGEKVLSGAWIPWTALAIAWLTSGERIDYRRVALTALSLAMIATAGDPFLWLHAVALGLAVATPRFIPRVAPAVVLAVLVASPALVPAIALIGETERAHGLGSQASLWSMHPVRLLELVAPGALGDLTDYVGGRLVGEPKLGATPWAMSLYAGAAILLFAPFAKHRALLAVAILGVFFALGRHVHVLLPLMRYPEKHVLVTIGALALLASLGCERVLAGEIPLKRLPIPFALAAVLAIAAAPSDLRRLVLMGIAQSALVALMLFGVVMMSRRRAVLTPLIPALVAVDLFLAAIPFLHFIDPREPPFVALIRGSTAPYPPRLYRPRVGSGFETLPDNVGELYRIAHVPGHDAAMSARFHELWDRLPGELAMSLFAIDWMIAPSGPPGLAPLGSVSGVHLFRWPTPVRLHLVNHVTLGDDAASSLDAAIVANADGARPITGTGEPGSCVFERYENESLAITCDASQPSLMVLADSYATGWSATLDGAPATIHRTTVVLRGVYLEPGHHRIEMRYRTPGLTLGLALGALGLLLCAILLRPRRGAT